MFQLDTKMVKVTSLNFRKEKDEKGDEHGVCDIGFSAPMENEVLYHFNPLYRPAFYTGDDQADMVSGARLPHLKFAFPRFSHKGSLEGYTFLAHIGAGGPSEVKLNDSVINKVHFQLQDKGAVGMDFIVRARTHPADVGKLSELLDTEVQISLVPPDEKKRFEIEQAKKHRRQKLEDQFNRGGGQPPAEPDTRTGQLLEGGDGSEDEERDPNADHDAAAAGGSENAGQHQFEVE